MKTKNTQTTKHTKNTKTHMQRIFMLGLPPKKRLFNVISSTYLFLTSWRLEDGVFLLARGCIWTTKENETYLPGRCKIGGQARATFWSPRKKLGPGIVQFQLRWILRRLEPPPRFFYGPDKSSFEYPSTNLLGPPRKKIWLRACQAWHGWINWWL